MFPYVDDDSYEEDIVVYNKQDEDSTKLASIMLATMSPELQKSFENVVEFEINEQLKEMFQEQARQERIEIVKSLMSCKHQDGNFMCVHAQKMKSYIDRLGNLVVEFP